MLYGKINSNNANYCDIIMMPKTNSPIHRYENPQIYYQPPKPWLLENENIFYLANEKRYDNLEPYLMSSFFDNIFLGAWKTKTKTRSILIFSWKAYHILKFSGKTKTKTKTKTILIFSGNFDNLDNIFLEKKNSIFFNIFLSKSKSNYVMGLIFKAC